MREIRRPRLVSGAPVSSRTLGRLPVGLRPDLDDLLATRLENDTGTLERDADLLARYASPAVAGRVRVVFQKYQQAACDLEDGFLTYFARVDPSFAIQAIRNYKGSCTLDAPLRELKQRGQWAAVEPLILAQLESDRPQVLRRAAEALQRYGSQESEAALWRRMERFHKEFSQRQDDLREGPKVSAEVRSAMEAQFVLVTALSAGQAWLFTPERSARLGALIVGPDPQLPTGDLSDPLLLTISLSDGRLTASVEHYVMNDLASIRARLAQFPTGTRLTLHITGEGEDDVESTLEDVRSLAVAAGLQVVDVQKTVVE